MRLLLWPYGEKVFQVIIPRPQEVIDVVLGPHQGSLPFGVLERGWISAHHEASVVFGLAPHCSGPWGIWGFTICGARRTFVFVQFHSRLC